MSVDLRSPLHGACTCGTCSFETKVPTVRFICHCLICQAFNGKPFSDVTVIRAREVTLHNAGHISFKKYRPPPNLNRGRCMDCGKPVVETAGAGPLKLMFIPSDTFAAPELLPPAQMHIFYHRRVSDVQDDLPKHEGYWRSQLAVGRLLMARL
jgi:hypothetical protein